MTDERYRVGLATGRFGGKRMFTAIQDTQTGKVYPMGGDVDNAEEVVRCLNEGMPNPLIAGIALEFRTFSEAVGDIEAERKR